MHTRRWWALLVLAAVFTMHGLQSAAVEMSGMPGDHAVVASPPVNGFLASPSEKIGPMAVDETPLHSVAGAVSARLLQPMSGQVPDAEPHGLVHALWTLCLGVLAAGLIALLAMTGTRVRIARQQLTLVPATRALAGVTASRPPDLHSLCLLRT